MTRRQLRMVRAGMGWSVQEVARAFHVTVQQIEEFEDGLLDALPATAVEAMDAIFPTLGIYLGPDDSVAIGVNVWHEMRAMLLGAFQLLDEHEVDYRPKALFAAYNRMRRRLETEDVETEARRKGEQHDRHRTANGHRHQRRHHPPLESSEC